LTGMTPEPIDDSINGTDDRRSPDLGALRRSDELFDALSERRAVSSDDADDPAFALLKALVDDVDAGAPPLSPAAGHGRTGRPPRRVPRTLVSVCVATTVLMTTGVAAAGGVLTPFAPTPGGSESHIRSRPDLPEAGDAAGGGVSGSPRMVLPRLKRREAVVPPSGETADTDDGHSQGPGPTKPAQVTSTPYGLYVGPPDTPSPTPGSGGSPDPGIGPSATPGQGQPGVAGQQSPPPGQQGPTP
jgi:hypothetical protein